ncbi:N-acetylglucosamine-6-phosphate deacetylase [Planococcus plakortidis]|uniref:N-acetylglucosamine-6-phosphate deacetylase n=1 Tax=Planococcus plakortidis TaxID=1038856 RepID=A0A1C7ECB4_9BACL|nr:N-acetylglucosamine-6-phosphate deacetylase [Planococcus plakortidis]ANU21355.1 N-acetylglucosamine-6-phosphate deacetylase [Planococcus plakortidis]
MGKSLLFSNVLVVDEDGVERIDVLTADGRIEKMGHGLVAKDAQAFDGRGKILMPGFIDIHVHGANGFDVMDADAAALSGIAQALPKEGVTAFVATTMTQTEGRIARAVETAGKYRSADGEAELLGIHLEGPFLSPEQAGAQNPEHFLKPELDLFNHWQALGGGRIRIVTLAPELEGADKFIAGLEASGVIASIGHSAATYEQTVASNAQHVTHLFNQMTAFHHREPGVVGAAMLDSRFRVELIADLIHNHPAAVKLAYQQIGAGRLILITDAMRAKGLGYGNYDLGGQTVVVDETGTRIQTGRLAGSVLTMDRALRNVRDLAQCSLPELAQMSSGNAAAALGLHGKGKIARGMDADLVLMTEALEVELTVCRGEIAFSAN